MIMPQADTPTAGFRPFFNPATGEWITYTAIAEDNGGQLVRFTWRSVPGGVITEHIHPRQEERFTILAGEAHFTLNGQQHMAGAGETVIVPAGVPHSEGNPGPGEIEGIVELRPALRAKELHEAFAGLVADGKTTPRGAPRNPLQLGATFWHFRHESRVTSPPIWAQNLMLPRYGHWPGPSASAPTTTAGTAGPESLACLMEDTEMNMTDPIRRVSVVSMGQVQTHYTVRQAADDWLTHGLEGRSPATIKKNQNVLQPLLKVIGARKLRDLTAADVRQALATMAAGYSTAAVSIGHLALKRAIRHTEANDLIHRNVATLADTPQGQPGRPSQSLTLDQAIAVIAAAATLPVMELRPGLKDVRRPAELMHAYIVLSLLAGIRTEEARALHWAHINLNGDPAATPPVPPHIAVWRSVRTHGDTKTERSRRTLAIPAAAVPLRGERLLEPARFPQGQPKVGSGTRASWKLVDNRAVPVHDQLPLLRACQGLLQDREAIARRLLVCVVVRHHARCDHHVSGGLAVIGVDYGVLRNQGGDVSRRLVNHRRPAAGAEDHGTREEVILSRVVSRNVVLGHVKRTRACVQQEGINRIDFGRREGIKGVIAVEGNEEHADDNAQRHRGTYPAHGSHDPRGIEAPDGGAEALHHSSRH